MEQMSVIVAQATGLLMERFSIMSNEAAGLLDAEANNRGMTLRDVAIGVVNRELNPQYAAKSFGFRPHALVAHSSSRGADLQF